MALLNMLGSGSFSADERPLAWRRTINLAFPNGDVPLTAILSMSSEDKVSDPDYRWFEKGLPVMRDQVRGAKATTGAADGDDVASAAVADGAVVSLRVNDTTIFNPGQVLMNLTTEELYLVVAKETATNPGNLSVLRDFGAKFGTNPAITGDVTTGDFILIVGNGSPENALSKDPISYQPARHFNYCQIFRNSFGFSRTALRTALRTDPEGPFQEGLRECFQLHCLDIERALLLGERTLTTTIASAAGNLTGVGAGTPLRTTRGFINWLPAVSTSLATPAVNWDIGTANTGNLTEDIADAWLEEIFRVGGSEKLALAGSTALSAWNKLAKTRFEIQAVPTDQTYGLALTRYKTPWGDLLLKQHPLLSHDAILRKDMYAIDTPFLKLRVLDDTELRENVQANDLDGVKHEFVTELGLEINFSGATPATDGGLPGTPAPAAHGRLKGVANFAG